MDYPNNYLTHPSPWESPEAVCLIIYFSDANECGGMTRLVPREGADDEAYQWPYVEMPGVGRHEWINDRATTEAYFKEHDPAIYRFRKQLYERERAVAFQPGTVLLYRLDTWHRGAPMRAGASTTRRVVNMLLRRADAEWITDWNQGVARSVYAGADEIIVRATAEQRSLLGFPAPGHRYWTDQTIAAARARYGAAMDMSEYEAALRGGAVPVRSHWDQLGGNGSRAFAPRAELPSEPRAPPHLPRTSANHSHTVPERSGPHVQERAPRRSVVVAYHR